MLRAKLDSQMQDFKELMETTFQRLTDNKQAHWYVSMVAEKRSQRSFGVNPKGENLSEDLSLGWILRVYDGSTLFEEAGDSFEEKALFKAVDHLMASIPKPQGDVPKAYQSPGWEERCSKPLEAEILEQIPKGASPQTWVHFGITLKSPLFATDAEAMAYTKERFTRLQKWIESSELNLAPVDFSSVGLRMEKVDFLFIDESVRMSQTLHRNMSSCMALKQGQRGHALVGGLGGRETLEMNETDFKQVELRLDKALKAEKIKPGRYKVLMSPSVTGVFAHEAFGHSQEGDTWARGRSKARELYESKTRVGNDFATILNNPAIYKNGADDFAAWGSYFFDEEGWLAEKHYLVDKGFLNSPMTDLTSALRLKVARTANGKRESWTHGVYTRQTNTYFAPGEQTFEEMISQVDYGFLASNPWGGMEDPKGMGIQVGMAYVEEIKDGQLTGRSFVAPNGGAIQMTGYVPDYLNSILAVSKIDAYQLGPDESQHPWNEVGGCGKYHKEYVVAGCGGPYLLVDQVLLG